MDNTDLSAIDQLIDIARGATDADPVDIENRNTRRVDFESKVAFVQWTPTGGKSIATIVDSKNISSSGVAVYSRYMLHVGHEGALLVTRSNGQEVLVGVKVIHCKYVGDHKHESGLSFVALADHFTLEDFRDEHGNMPQLHKKAA